MNMLIKLIRGTVNLYETCFLLFEALFHLVKK